MNTPDLTAKPEYLRRTEALIAWIERHDRECDAEETVPLEVLNELVAITRINSNITAAQVEQFMRDQHARLRERTGSAGIITLGIGSGEHYWCVEVGLCSPKVGSNLAELLDAAAQAMSPDRRAMALREQARALLAEADALTPEVRT